MKGNLFPEPYKPKSASDVIEKDYRTIGLVVGGKMTANQSVKVENAPRPDGGKTAGIVACNGLDVGKDFDIITTIESGKSVPLALLCPGDLKVGGHITFKTVRK